MTLDLLLPISSVYLLAVGFVMAYRNYKVNQIKFLNKGGERELISIFWAWCDFSSNRDILRKLETSEIETLLYREPDINGFKLFMPHVLLVISFISVYQIFRPAGTSGLGDCNQTPNCSNFAIGCFFRFNFIEAFKKTKLRLFSCSGKNKVSFSETFADDL